jgi:ATP-dependent RNA helicase SUPV3L1/SUV3
MNAHADILDSLLTPSTSAELKAHLAKHGARLQHVDGKVAVSFAGGFTVDGNPVSYHLIPEGGELAKKGRWNKMTPAQRLELAQSIVNDDLAEDCMQQVQDGVRDAQMRAFELDLPLSERMLGALDAPAFTVAARLRVLTDRIEAAGVQTREAGLVEKTRSAVTLADYPATYVQAHGMRRKFIALLGEPNSGKTHEAIEALVAARSGVYLAPLRLLALENYERLQARGVAVSMVTGEECRLLDGATHVASTIEMLNYQRPVEVAVIDEIQMLDDADRGAAWTAAVCGAPAPIVYLVGSLAARAAVESLAKRLGCELEVRELHRKSKLSVEPQAVRSVAQLRKGDAVIAFSRRDVLYWRDTLTVAGFTVATIYGNLSPEVRRAQAALFREGRVDVLVGTDALAMGLNMPIERVVFSCAEKFDGVDDNLLPAWLTQQIGGRAGRYGITEEGFVAGYGDATHRKIRALMAEKLEPTRKKGFFVAPTIEHLKQIRAATGEDRLAQLLERFTRNIDTHDDYFLPANLTEQLERAQWLDTLPLALEDRFLLSLVPISTKASMLAGAFEHWATQWSRSRVCHLQPVPLSAGAKGLQTAEDACKLYSAYAWLGYRRPEFFPDVERAVQLVRETSDVIDNELRKDNERTRGPKATGAKQGKGRSGRGQPSPARATEKRTPAPQGATASPARAAAPQGTRRSDADSRLAGRRRGGSPATR